MSTLPSPVWIAFENADKWVQGERITALIAALKTDDPQWSFDPQENYPGRGGLGLALIASWPSYPPENDRLLAQLIEVLQAKGVPFDRPDDKWDNAFHCAQDHLRSHYRTLARLECWHKGQDVSSIDPRVEEVRGQLMMGGRNIGKIATTKDQWMELIQGIPLAHWVWLEAQTWEGCGWGIVPRINGKDDPAQAADDRAKDMLALLKNWSKCGVDDKVAWDLAGHMLTALRERAFHSIPSFRKAADDAYALLPDPLTHEHLTAEALYSQGGFSRKFHALRLTGHSNKRDMKDEELAELGESLCTLVGHENTMPSHTARMGWVFSQASYRPFLDQFPKTPKGLALAVSYWEMGNNMVGRNVPNQARFRNDVIAWMQAHQIPFDNVSFLKLTKNIQPHLPHWVDNADAAQKHLAAHDPPSESFWENLLQLGQVFCEQKTIDAATPQAPPRAKGPRL